MKIVLTIPVYNEEAYLKDFMLKLSKEKKALSQIDEIVFMNDGSTDSSLGILHAGVKGLTYKVSSHKNNKGKGETMREGLRYAKDHNFDGIIFMDSDMQHDPKHLSAFITALKKESLVFGYRLQAEETPYIRRLGNIVVRFVFKTFFNIKRRDLLCGFIAIGKAHFEDIVWSSDGYGVEPEIAAIVGRKKWPFKEICIDTIYLDPRKGLQLIDAFFIVMKIPFWYFRY